MPFSPTDFFVLSAIAGGGVFLGGVANRATRTAYHVDLTRWLTLAAIVIAFLALALSFLPSLDRSSSRVGFFLALGAGLFGLLALGARSAVRRTPIPATLRIGLYVLAALVITFASVALAFLLMWGDLHFEQPQEI